MPRGRPRKPRPPAEVERERLVGELREWRVKLAEDRAGTINNPEFERWASRNYLPLAALAKEVKPGATPTTKS